MGTEESNPSNGWTGEQAASHDGEIVYAYEDEQGQPLFQVVRREGKRFLARRRSADGGWVWNLDGVARVIYRLPEVVLADEVYLVEGEKDVETLRKLGLATTTNPCGAGGWKPEFARFFRSKHVVLIADEDEPGHAWADRVLGDVRFVAASVKRVRLPGLVFGSGADVTDWLAAGHDKKELLALVDQTKPVADRVLVGGRLIEDLEHFFGRYLCLDSDVSLLLALWTLGTHFFPEPQQSEDLTFDQYPYLHVTGPTKRSGKSRVGEMIALLGARPELTAGFTEAALFRLVDQEVPTLVIDEAESLNRKGDERARALLAILNVGHRRGTEVVRCGRRSEGGGFELERYKAYCPKVIITIGDIPSTLADRSFQISMKRRPSSEKLDRFLHRDVTPVARELQERMGQWAKENRDAVDTAYAVEPVSLLEDREAESWLPLFALCRVACPDKMARLGSLARRLSGEKEADDQERSIRLLADIGTVFDEANTDFISTRQLLVALHGMEDAPWGEPGRELSSHRLGLILRSFGVRSERRGGRSDRIRGYSLGSFEDAFRRYLPHRGSDHAGHGTQDQQHAGRTETGHGGAVPTVVAANNLLERKDVAGVAASEVAEAEVAATSGLNSEDSFGTSK